MSFTGFKKGILKAMYTVFESSYVLQPKSVPSTTKSNSKHHAGNITSSHSAASEKSKLLCATLRKSRNRQRNEHLLRGSSVLGSSRKNKFGSSNGSSTVRGRSVSGLRSGAARAMRVKVTKKTVRSRSQTSSSSTTRNSEW